MGANLSSTTDENAEQNDSNRQVAVASSSSAVAVPANATHSVSKKNNSQQNAQRGQSSAVMTFEDKKKKLFQLAKQGGTSVMGNILSKCNGDELIRLLNAKNEDGKTIYQVAEKEKQLDVLDVLKRFPIMEISVDELCKACAEGDLPTVKRFVEHGKVDIEISDKDGQTALHFAVRNQKLDVARYLIEKGARVDREDNAGFFPFIYASECGSLQLCQLLANNGADVNQQWKVYGWTPLHFACLKGHLHIVKFLVDNGADVNQLTEKEGATPLRIAILKGDRQIVKLLVDNGADVNL